MEGDGASQLISRLNHGGKSLILVAYYTEPREPKKPWIYHIPLLDVTVTLFDPELASQVVGDAVEEIFIERRNPFPPGQSPRIVFVPEGYELVWLDPDRFEVGVAYQPTE